MAWGKGKGKDDDLPPMTPAQMCKDLGHDWTPIYDDDGNITGKICLRCSTEQ